MPSTNSDFDIALHERTPVAQWQIVEVEFPSTPDTDYEIVHRLKPPTAEEVEYTVLRQSTAGVVYEDRSAGRRKWGPNFIVLRSDTASWKGRLLLQVLKSARGPLESE